MTLAPIFKWTAAHVLIFLISCVAGSGVAADAVKTVVLTFDDSVKSQVAFVAPILKKHGFNATFFITEGFSFETRKDLYMTWEEVVALHKQGFEIGNHTRKHKRVSGLNEAQLNASLAHIEKRCETYGIPRPVSFCYPGYATSALAVKVLEERGYIHARAGGAKASVPATDNPLLLPQAFDGKPDSTLAQFKAAVDQADATHVPVLTFHGVPDKDHPWVSTTAETFTAYMNYLKEQNFRVIALRDYPQPAK